MTECAAPRHLDDADIPETEAHAVLCRPCRRGLHRDLTRLPGLHADLQALPHATRRGHGDGTGLPINEPASDTCAQILHDLTWWAMHITAERGTAAPRAAVDPRWRDDPVPVLAGWIAGQVQWISFRPWAGDMCGAMADNRQRAISLLDPWVRKRFAIPGRDGLCVNCGAGRLHVTIYASDGDKRRSHVECPACGQRWEPERWMRLGHDIIRRRELTG